MKTYEKPEFDVLSIEICDIVTASLTLDSLIESSGSTQTKSIDFDELSL